MIWIILIIWIVIAVITMSITKNERSRSPFMQKMMWLYRILTLPIQIVLLSVFFIVILIKGE